MKLKFLTIAVFVVMTLLSYGQNMLSPDSALVKLNNDYPIEKIFVHTDKTHYVAGETLWAKAWCTVDGIPSYLSNILYVSLTNSNGTVVMKKMYALDSMSTSSINLDLPKNMLEGNYTLYAYTLWMLNNIDYIFKKNIFIHNPITPKRNQSLNSTAIKMSFYPEGGDIIAGLPANIAFKVVDSYGLPIQIKGYITNKENQRVADFATEHEGMGSFNLTLADTTEYTANIERNGNNLLQFKLPKVKQTGVSLTIDNSNSNRLVVLVNKPENVKQPGIIKLVAHINHQLVFSRKLNLDEGENAVPLTKKNLPSGIIHFTVFDETNIPLAERLAFIDNTEITAPAILNPSVNSSPRKLNSFSFKLKDNVKASLSVRITDEVLDAANKYDNNIVSCLLLTSDIKGHVNNPGYYFSNKSDSVKKHLDLLMLTQGWRRFVWNKIIANEFPVLKYPVETGMTIKGKATKSDRKEPVQEGIVSFIIRGEDSTNIMSEAKLTDKGEFIVDGITFKKEATVAYQGTNKKKENLIIDVSIYPSHIDSLSKLIIDQEINLDTVDLANRKSALSAYLYNQISKIDTTGNNYLGNVTVSSKRISKKDSLNNAYATGPFQMGQTINPEEYKNYSTIWQVLQAAVPGIRISGDFFNPAVSFGRYDGIDAISQASAAGAQSEIGGTTFNGMLDENNGIAYFLNEINVSKDIIATLDVNDVALIKSMKLEAAALGASQGALAFYTKKGVSIRNKPYEKTFTTMQKQGYAITREFFNPNYSIDSNLNKLEDDKRYTLFWNSNLKPQKDGSYLISFFNNDISKSFKIIIQGLTKDGKLILGETVLK